VWNKEFQVMEEITLQVQRDEESGLLVAWWDHPSGLGGITTQGQDLRDLQEQITEAVAVHFDEEMAPQRIRIHFVSDPILVQT
jgi:predicted RNase H-like HicB family nuclease